MDLTSVKTIKELLSKYDAQPLKTMGQNFLVNKFVLDKIIIASDVGPKDIVLEIGPGIGTLTKELSKIAEKVIAVEKDKKMVEILKETLENQKNVEVVQGDVLLTTNYQLPTHYKVVANLPYYVTSPVIRKFLETKNPPDFMVLMVQKEVAQRICAKPPGMSLLAVSVQFYANAEIISYVKKSSFWPSPKVDSAIIKITPFKKTRRRRASVGFFNIVKAGFSQPRKQLANNLSKGLGEHKEKVQAWLLKNNIEPSQRAETLSVENWISLTNDFSRK